MTISESEKERLSALLDDPESFYEDYALVLAELREKGIVSVLCEVWCENCEEESEAQVDTGTFMWTCPCCGTVSDQ